MSQEYHRIRSSFNAVQNTSLKRSYNALKEKDIVEKTHYFAGRFENIYIPQGVIPALNNLLDESIQHAGKILGMDSASLKSGFWFNEMQHGDSTSAHTHDEDDELLSGVYYINVPKDSGDLILGDENHDDAIRITPQAGEFIFFKPDCLHNVTENQSEKMRLSIGMNFGPKNG